MSTQIQGAAPTTVTPATPVAGATAQKEAGRLSQAGTEGTAGATEGAKPEEKPADKVEEKKDDKFSSKFAALAKRERKILEREARVKELESRFSDYDKRDQEFKRDPLKNLKERHGLTLDDLTKLALNQGKPTPEMIAREAKEEVARLRQEQEEKEQARLEKEVEAQKASTNRQIEQFKTQIGSFIDQNADTYELTKTLPDASDVIYGVIEHHYMETLNQGEGRIMTLEEAAQLVEAHLEAEAKKLMSAKKFQPKGEGKTEDGKDPKAASTQAASSPSSSSSSSSSRTLTNAHQTEVATPAKSLIRSLEESKAEAARLLRWS